MTSEQTESDAYEPTVQLHRWAQKILSVTTLRQHNPEGKPFRIVAELTGGGGSWKIIKKYLDQ